MSGRGNSSLANLMKNAFGSCFVLVGKAAAMLLSTPDRNYLFCQRVYCLALCISQGLLMRVHLACNNDRVGKGGSRDG